MLIDLDYILIVWRTIPQFHGSIEVPKHLMLHGFDYQVVDVTISVQQWFKSHWESIIVARKSPLVQIAVTVVLVVVVVIAVAGGGNVEFDVAQFVAFPIQIEDVLCCLAVISKPITNIETNDVFAN